MRTRTHTESLSLTHTPLSLSNKHTKAVLVVSQDQFCHQGSDAVVNILKLAGQVLRTNCIYGPNTSGSVCVNNISNRNSRGKKKKWSKKCPLTFCDKPSSPNSTVNARWCFVLFLFFLVNCHYTESPACKLNVAVFSSSSLLPEKLVCSCTAVGHTFCLAVCRSGHRCSTCLAVWSSRLQLVMVPASFSWTCGRWVSCGLCVVSWPQPAATSWGSGSHPSQFVATRLLWWGLGSAKYSYSHVTLLCPTRQNADPAAILPCMIITLVAAAEDSSVGAEGRSGC